jgi:hypothetical protein
MAVVAEEAEKETQWDAYSDYQLVSKGVTKVIHDAIEAYALLDQSAHTGNKVGTKEETRLRADILAAAMRLRVELESERDRGEDYASEILEDWEGDDGYINRFRRAPFNGTTDLEWFADFVSQIRRAGWELGYLKAGREEQAEHQGDEEDSEVYDLINNMTL